MHLRVKVGAREKVAQICGFGMTAASSRLRCLSPAVQIYLLLPRKMVKVAIVANKVCPKRVNLDLFD